MDMDVRHSIGGKTNVPHLVQQMYIHLFVLQSFVGIYCKS
jgi:hypothetical protein